MHHIHRGIKIQQASCAVKTIIEKNAVALRAIKTTDIDFPIGMPECIDLLCMNTQIVIEVQQENILQPSLLLPFLGRESTQIAISGAAGSSCADSDRFLRLRSWRWYCSRTR